MSFDQPTNQPAGCPLAAATVALLVESATDASFATCAWRDASTLVAYLTSTSTAGPGSALSLAAGAVWPEGWAGRCADDADACSGTAEPFLLPTVALCNDILTTAAEECLQPLATIAGPSVLLLCPGVGLSLTGEYTTAEGSLSPRPPTYQWGVARGSDNYGPISAHLAAHSSAELLDLGAELLDGGDHFEITLQAAGVAGQTAAL